jgi:hypothetical protein
VWHKPLRLAQGRQDSIWIADNLYVFDASNIERGPLLVAVRLYRVKFGKPTVTPLAGGRRVIARD